MKEYTFTISKGLEVQTNNLAEWKRKLNKKTYLKVLNKCAEENKKPMTSGYEVFRGDAITTFIKNIK